MKFNTFIFESFEWKGDTLHLRYSLDDQEFFEETWTFPTNQRSTINDQRSTQSIVDSRSVDPLGKVLHQASKGLWLMCGISYYKAFLPQEIKIKSEKLTEKQAAFFEKIYLHGLGELFYRNNITPPKIKFPSASVTQLASYPVDQLSGTLIPIGGGKDSLVTVEILKAAGVKNISTWCAGDYPFFKAMIDRIGLPHLVPERRMDPRLFELNEQGAINGHIPISAIWAFESVLTALLSGHKNIAFSNEASANDPNTYIGDLAINHQYSKSLEFEQDFQQYVHNFITPSVNYFSFLRPLSELFIAQIFCSKGRASKHAAVFDKYKTCFSSCNANFRISKQKNTSSNFIWCAKCPKCTFVACLFAPFLPKQELIGLFGRNPFTSPEMTQHLPALLGLEDIKPFECVGEAIEVQEALKMAYKTGDYPELEKWIKQTAHCSLLTDNWDYQSLHPHAIPDEFFKILRSAVES